MRYFIHFRVCRQSIVSCGDDLNYGMAAYAVQTPKKIPSIVHTSIDGTGREEIGLKAYTWRARSRRQFPYPFNAFMRVFPVLTYYS